jgi:hypothetical protein
MAGKQPLDIAGKNPLQGCDELWNVAAVMSIDRPD